MAAAGSPLRLAGMKVGGITKAGTIKKLPAVVRLLVVESEEENTQRFLLTVGATEFAVYPGQTVLAYTDGTPDGLACVVLSTKSPSTATPTNGADGKPGAAGKPGTDGAPGSQIIVAKGPPKSSDGADGDVYIRDNGDVYQKTGGSWGKPLMNIKGKDGEPGPPGLRGHDGNDGAPGSGGGGTGGDALTQIWIVGG